MRNIFLCIIFIIFFCNFSYAEIISGKIDHNDLNYKNKIVDLKNQNPVSNAKISIPELNYTTFSDKDGTFKLNADFQGKTVLFVEKEGYKVFSLTVDNTVLSSPLKLGIEQASPFDMQITQGVIHLGDDMYSTNSANSNEFKTNAKGSSLIKTFAKPKYGQNDDIVLRIGTIIGLDTKRAKENGQNKIAQVYSSPAEVLINGKKIAHIELNGDNIEILIPKNILKEKNELIIKTGRNLFQHDYIDYDDIELANVRIETTQRHYYARH